MARLIKMPKDYIVRLVEYYDHLIKNKITRALVK